MSEGFVTKAEYKEHNARMEDEHKRINHRLHEAEENLRQIGELTISVKEIAISMKNMSEEQKALRTDMEEMKGRDGEMWRKATGYIITAVVGAVVGFIFTQIGM